MAVMTHSSDFQKRRDGKRDERCKKSGLTCPIHHRFLTATSTQGNLRYLKCPEPGCTHRRKESVGR